MEVSRPGKQTGSQIENRHGKKTGLEVQAPVLEKGLDGKAEARHAGSVTKIAEVRQFLSMMDISFSKESAAVAELAMELSPSMLKKEMQAAVRLLEKFEFKESIAVLRFMLQHGLPVNEAVFQPLLTARHSPSLTNQLQTLQAELKQSGELTQNLFKAIGQLLEVNANILETKPPAAFWKEKLQLLGIDDEAQIGKQAPNLFVRSVKQELLQLLSQTLPAPIRELTEQAVGKLNAQHILSAESGFLQQVVMQIPVCLPAFQGDVTIKWEGKKKNDGQIDADFCRVFFWLQMPNLGSTSIDMQVQNRIVHLTIAAEKNSSQLKALSAGPALFLKQALEESGYLFSGLTYHALTQSKQPFQKAEPIAQIMDERRRTEVDIRI